MQAFQTILDTVPISLAFQDALTNSVTGGGATPPGTTGAPVGGGSGAGQGNPFQFLLPLILIMGFFNVFSMLTSRKEKKKREQLLSSIRKGDKILTIGGMIGTVADLRDDEVVLKIDENANGKVRFARSSIQQVLKSTSGGESAGASGGAMGGAAGTGTEAAAQIEVKSGRGPRVNA